MSAATNGEPDPTGSSSTEAPDGTIPESQLQRMDPDSILADEANLDQVLGQGSSDTALKRLSTGQDHNEEAAALKRASAASAIFSHDHSRPQSQAISTPEADSATAQMSTESLQAQVKDLTNQVTGLNEKLVRSFNRIADLEDDYSDAQEQLRSMSTKIKELEKERAEHLDALNTGLLVEKAHVSNEMQRMMDRVIEETAQRGKAESDKSKIEAELDELSSSLFSEANKMVAVERLSRARAEEKSRNMEERLKDTEGIMLEQQKVLADLQRQVEKLQSGSTARQNGDDTASIASIDSEAVSFHRLKTSSLARSISQRTAMQERKHKPHVDLAAEARLIINIVPYQEFRAFIAHLRKTRKQLAPFYNYPLNNHGARDSLNGTPTPRTASPAISQSTNTSTSLTSAASAYSQGLGGAISTTSPFAIAGVSRHRDYPTLPANVESMVSLPSQLSLPFIKRSQEEDVEPCLRLDFAPGLNWLSRRQANTAILDGNLVIEPIFSGSKTIDQDQIRRENAQLPPAACAMCGIPVVNVPLPGGVAATALSAEQGGKTSLVPTSIATATSSWASSAANSFGSITGSSSSSSGSGTITPKPSRGGLFSSFRKSSTNVKAAMEADAAAQTASAASEGDAQAVVAPQGLVLSNLPVPTHIFRLSDSSPTRYLLCPHHCLLRLRAACQYWGFVRNLERSVVLEGKFMNEEQLGGSTSSLDLPKDVATKSEQVETLEKAVAAAEESKDEADAVPEMTVEDGEKAKDEAEAALTENVDGETEGDKTEAEKMKESVSEEVGAEEETAESGEEQAEALKKESTSPVDTSSEEDKKPAGEDDDFADAPSSPTEPKPAEFESKEEEAANSEMDNSKPDADAVESSKAQDPAVTADTASSGANTTDVPKQPDTPNVTAPPLPPRSVARSTNTGSPAPVIPPRRHLTPAPPATTTAPNTTSAAVPAPPTALYLNNLDAMEWEDKMWTELTKLKEELWRARIGLVEDGEA